MKLLFFEWSGYMQADVETALKNIKGIELTCLSYDFKNIDEDAYFMRAFPSRLTAGDYDCVFSVNFFPPLSDLCEQYHIPYISWVYDAPLSIRRTSSLANSVNRVYVFDRGQYKDLRNAGYSTVFHCPLGVNTQKIESMDFSEADVHHFSSQISFVGTLYNNEYANMMQPLSPSLQECFDQLIVEQLNTYGSYLIEDFLTEERMEEINLQYRKATGDSRYCINARQMNFLLAREVTHRERMILLNVLSNHYDVALYSTNDASAIPKIRSMGIATYDIEMPKVFSLSKINLNITLKCIKEGMPLRILDILGAGGLLFSNYQAELAENFIDGKEVVLYHSLTEAVEKAGYYLAHEEERCQIAINGHQKVHELYEMQKQVEWLLSDSALL